MWSTPLYSILASAVLTAHNTHAQSCSKGISTSKSRPVAADGWSFRLVASDLARPRSILFDNDGALLVVDSGVGIKRLLLEDEGGTCLYVKEEKILISSLELNHGIALSTDGKILYASTSDKVYSWSYDATEGSVSRVNKTIVNGMHNAGHTTRTLLLSRKAPGLLIVSRGSEGNVDELALRQSSGHSQLRAFNVSSLPDGAEPYNFTSDGTMLGWGLRNSVGVAEHPNHGGIWTVENSVDNLERDGVDIHHDNPGEELNFHGYLNGSNDDQGGNYGYPQCLALWSTDDFPQLGDMRTGDQFDASDAENIDDEACNTRHTAPRLAFQAHTAPLDIEFTSDGHEAFISFHGSWNRDQAVGYSLSKIVFVQGSPEESAVSTNATSAILSNADINDCPDKCFRPVGLAWDTEGRLFMTSDSTGEIFVLQRSTSPTGEDSFRPTATPATAATPGITWPPLLLVVIGMILSYT